MYVIYLYVDKTENTQSLQEEEVVNQAGDDNTLTTFAPLEEREERGLTFENILLIILLAGLVCVCCFVCFACASITKMRSSWSTLKKAEKNIISTEMHTVDTETNFVKTQTIEPTTPISPNSPKSMEVGENEGHMNEVHYFDMPKRPKVNSQHVMTAGNVSSSESEPDLPQEHTTVITGPNRSRMSQWSHDVDDLNIEADKLKTIC